MKTLDSMGRAGRGRSDPSGLGRVHPHCWPTRRGKVVTGTRDHLRLGHTAGVGGCGGEGGGCGPQARFSPPPPQNIVIRATDAQAVNGIGTIFEATVQFWVALTTIPWHFASFLKCLNTLLK